MRPGSAIVVVVVFTVLAALTHAQESPPQAQPAKLAGSTAMLGLVRRGRTP